MANIVIVNDEEDLVDMCADILRESGHRAFPTADPSAAPGLVADKHAEVLVLDLLVPGTTGEQILQRVQASAGDLPTVVMSASVDGAERARKMGARAFLAKPFEASALVAAVEQALRARPGERVAQGHRR